MLSFIPAPGIEDAASIIQVQPALANLLSVFHQPFGWSSGPPSEREPHSFQISERPFASSLGCSGWRLELWTLQMDGTHWWTPSLGLGEGELKQDWPSFICINCGGRPDVPQVLFFITLWPFTVLASSYHHFSFPIVTFLLFLFLKKYLFIYLFVCLAVPGIHCSTWDLRRSMHVGSSSPTRDQTWAHRIGSAGSYPLDHQGSPPPFFFFSTFFTSCRVKVGDPQ